MSRSMVRICVLLMSLCLMASSCRLIRKKPNRRNVTVDSTATTTVDTTSNQVTVPTLSPEKQQIVAYLAPQWQQQVDFTTFVGKAKMHYEGKGEKQDFNANFRIKKDSVIWISVTAAAFGIVNVARVLVTPDSLLLINYLQNEVYRMPISEANKLLPTPVDFATLQNLIIGNALKNTGTPTDASDFGGTLSLQVEDNQFIQLIAFNKADTTMRTYQFRTREVNGPQGIIQFGKYDMMDGRRFSTTRAINLINAGEQHYIDMNFVNANFGQAVDFPFSIPRSFNRK